MHKCKHCGAELAEGVKFCHACGKSVEEAPAQKEIGEIKAAVKETVQAEVKPLKESVDGLEKRLKAVEDLPMKAQSGFAVISKEVYRGYKLHDQGEKLREKFSKSPYRFKALSNCESFDNYCKFVLDFKAAILGDVKAKQKLQEARAVAKASDMGEDVSDALGGYAVPIEYERDLIKLVEEDTFAMNECTVIPMSSNVKKIPAELTRVGVTWEDEGGTIDGQNPTLSQVTLTAKKLAGLTSSISSELISDSMFDIVGWLTEQFMYAMGLELDNQVLNGTGSPVSGVLTAACGNSVVMATGSTSFSAVTADYIRKLIRALSAKDSANAKFVYSKDIQYYIDVLKDSNNRYIYRDPAGERPAALWNRPIIEASNAPLEANSGASTAFIALGDWKKFYIGNRLGTMQFAADPYTAFATDEIRFRVIRRWALAFGRASAFVRLVTAAQ